MTLIEKTEYEFIGISQSRLSELLTEFVESYLPKGSNSRIYHVNNSTLIASLTEKEGQNSNKALVMILTEPENKDNLVKYLKEIVRCKIKEKW